MCMYRRLNLTKNKKNINLDKLKSKLWLKRFKQKCFKRSNSAGIKMNNNKELV